MSAIVNQMVNFKRCNVTSITVSYLSLQKKRFVVQVNASMPLMMH